MKKFRNLLRKNFHYLCIISVIALGLITIIGSGGGGGGGGDGATPNPVPETCEVTSGEWSGTAGFGELSFIVNDTSTGIPKITYSWIGFTCGAVTRNGSVTISTNTPWPITDSQFTINNTIDSNFEITLDGTFNDTCTSVSGTWEAVSFGTTCSGTWNASTCDGPVPCLTTDWGNLYREFEELDGSPILVLSYGDIFAGAGIDDFNRILSLGGTVTDCYNGEITLAGIDLNGDGILQDPGEFFDASGNAKICDRTLTVTNLIIDGAAENDIEATYVGTYTASVHITSEVPPEILFETMDKLKED